MTTGICKNEKDELKTEKKENKNNFKFWIYFALIILGILFIIIIVFLLYSFLSSSSSNNNKSPIIHTPFPKSDFLSSNIVSSEQFVPPPISSTNISVPKPNVNNTTTISSNTVDIKKPFLTKLMNTTTEQTGKTLNTLISPLYQRIIPVNKTGGFRCLNKKRL